MEGSSRKPPDFALLIGKRLDKKGGGPGGPPSPMSGDGEEKGGEAHQMALSAMTDFIDAVHAKDPEAACAALDDYYEIEEKEEADESPEEEASEGEGEGDGEAA